MASAEFAFVPNLTPNSYEDDHVAQDAAEKVSGEPLPIRFLDAVTHEVHTAEGPPLMSPSQLPKREPRRKRKSQSPGHVPRPPNAFILFRIDFVKKGRLPGNLETHASLSKMAAEKWKALSPPERAHWDAQAEIERRAHRLQYPDYYFKPQMKKPKPPPKPKVEKKPRKPPPPPKPRHVSVPHRDNPPDLPPQPRTRAPVPPRQTNQDPRQWMQQGVFMADNEQDVELQRRLGAMRPAQLYPPVPPPPRAPSDASMEEDCNAFEQSDFDYYYERMLNAQASLAVSATADASMPPPPPPPMDVDVDMSEASTPSLEADHPPVAWVKQEDQAMMPPPSPPPPKRCLARVREATFPYSYVADSQPGEDTGFELVSPIYQRLATAKASPKDSSAEPTVV